MNAFTYSYPVKVYFGEKAAEKNLAVEKEIADSVTLTPGGYGHLTHEDVLNIFEMCK